MRNDVNEHVREICGENWLDEEKDGGYGVAMVYAYIKGCRPLLNDLAKYLSLPCDELNKPFIRLEAGGIFSKKFDARHDLQLLKKCGNNKTQQEEWGQRAWAFVAGIASGK